MLMILARVRKQLLLYALPCVKQCNRKIKEELIWQVRVLVSPLLQPVAMAIVCVEVYQQLPRLRVRRRVVINASNDRSYRVPAIAVCRLCLRLHDHGIDARVAECHVSQPIAEHVGAR